MRQGLSHAYPSELTSFVIAQLEQLGLHAVGLSFPADADVVSAALTVAYQASLLRDEDRPLTFRLAIGPARAFDSTLGPPKGVHVLKFETPRPFAVHELKKLVSAAKFPRSIVAAGTVVSGDTEDLAIWGLLHTGPRWLQAIRGGRGAGPELPPILVAHVNGPGNLVISLGSVTLARLYAGELTIPMLDVFDSSWLPGMFSGVRAEVEALHLEQRSAHPHWHEVDIDIVRRIGQSFVRRIISTIRGAHHGGSLLVVPPNRVQELCAGRLVDLKYVFDDAEPRRRFRTLILSVLAELAGSHQHDGDKRKLGWSDYESSRIPAIVDLDEAIMELAYMIGALADVDGLVVMTQRFELVGFGGIISGHLPDATRITQALDVEGTARIEEPTDGMGTRHRAAYRIVRAVPDSLCIVISQDGGVRFVKWHEGCATYWDQVSASAFGG